MWQTRVAHTHRRDHVENISSVCWGHTLGFLDVFKLCSQHSTWEFKSFQQRSSNQFTTDSHCTSYKSIHSFAPQLYTSDLQICLSSSCMMQSTTQENQLKPVFSLLLPSAVESRISFTTEFDQRSQTHQFEDLGNSILRAQHVKDVREI